MKSVLYKNSKIEIRKSSINGYGVFAKENIDENEILEECYFIVLDSKIDELDEYKYYWPRSPKKPKNLAMPFGYACVYNTNLKSEPEKQNADWLTDEINNIFIFKTVKSIKKDEEILVYYGDDWWKQYGKNIKK